MPASSLLIHTISRPLVHKWLVVTCLAIISAGCQRAADPEIKNQVDASARGRPVIMTVNYPLLAMTQAIAGDFLTVKMPEISGDPAFWQPDTSTLIDYQQADRIIDNGAGYARWLATISLPRETLVDTSAGFPEQLIDLPGVRHSHGPGTAHDHGRKAFTTWLDMELAAAQATAITDAMLTLLGTATDSPVEARIRQNHADLQQKLAGYHRRLLSAGSKLSGTPVLYSHPVYQYLQRAYQLDGHALHWEPDQLPDASQWQGLTRTLEQHPARLMLWEGEPLPEVRERLNAMGLTVLVFSPSANYPASGDFWTLMEFNISALEGYVQTQTN